MRKFRPQALVTLLVLFCAAIASAQQSQPTVTAAVPKLVRFGGSFRPANGPASPSVESITLAVYRDQTGGTPLWQETQNVAVDATGNYSLLMGSTQNEGMPMELFASGEPRWLGTQINRPGEVEQPRVLMVSVPYALKASDAETLGGKPASAYLLAEPGSTGGNRAVGSISTSTTVVNAVKPKTTAGIMNFVAKFSDASGDLTNSTMYDFNGFVGFGTTLPNHRLHVFNSSPIVDSNLSGQLYVQNTYPTNSQGHASLVLDKGSATASAALSFNSVGVQVWDVGATDDNNFHIRSLGSTNPKPLTIEHGAAANSLYINASGNVGIGTQTPASKLDVTGDINFTGNLLYGAMQLLQAQPLNDPPSPGSGNLSLGLGALQHITAAASGANTAIGTLALQNTIAGPDTAVGYEALENNTIGTENTATGFWSLFSNLDGRQNTTTGSSTMFFNTSGSFNTANGAFALYQNTTGSGNTAIGTLALTSNATGSNNISIGSDSGSTIVAGDFNIDIGSPGAQSDNGAIRIGSNFQSRFFAAGIRGVTTANNDAIPVMIDSAGQLGTVSSSRRFKEDIEDMATASLDLMRLRPVTYRYKQPFADGSKPIQYGLIAEEVAEVYPDLVAHSADGQIETVKYQVLDSMLLNEVQRQQAEIGAQKDQLLRLELQNQSLQDRLTKLEIALTTTSGVLRIPLKPNSDSAAKPITIP